MRPRSALGRVDTHCYPEGRRGLGSGTLNPKPQSPPKDQTPNPKLHRNSTPHTLHATYYTLHATHHTLHTTNLHTTNYTLHTTHHILHTQHYNIHTTRYTLNTTHYIQHTTHYTLDSSPYTLDPPSLLARHDHGRSVRGFVRGRAERERLLY